MAEKTDEEKSELRQEIIDKYTLSKTYRQKKNFETNLDKWKDYYEGTSDETKDRAAAGRSAIFPPWPAVVVDHLLARFILAIFGKKPYFSTAPLNVRSIQSSKIANDVLFHQMDRPSFVSQVVRYCQSALAYGFGVLKTGWDFVENEPTISNVSIKHFYRSPHAEDITKLPWGIFELWRPLKDLKTENEAFEKRYKEPLYENLEELEDSYAEMLEGDQAGKYTEAEKKGLVHLLEYWDKEKKTVLANKKWIILDTENPVEFIPGICVSDTPKLEGIEGTGEIESIEGYVRQIATIINQRMDNVNMTLNPVWFRNVNIEIYNEEELSQLKPGLQIEVDLAENTPIENVLYPFKPDFITKESYLEVSLLEKAIQEKTGMLDYSRGEAPKQRETATGIARLQAVGNLIFRFKLLFALKTAFTLLPQQLNAWNQKYLPDDYVYLLRGTKEGIEEFRNTNRKGIQGDFKFKELISAIDPGASKEFERAQLLEALRILVAIREYLPNVDMDEFARQILETFEKPELSKVVKSRTEAESPIGLVQQMARRPGAGASIGARPRTEAGATEGRRAGGLMGRELGMLSTGG